MKNFDIFMHDDRWCQIDPCLDCIEETEERQAFRREAVDRIMADFDRAMEMLGTDKPDTIYIVVMRRPQ